ncbi:unnamed protein product, partial [Ectocarpus sp. 13 AM-2016]
ALLTDANSTRLTTHSPNEACLRYPPASPAHANFLRGFPSLRHHRDGLPPQADAAQAQGVRRESWRCSGQRVFRGDRQDRGEGDQARKAG